MVRPFRPSSFDEPMVRFSTPPVGGMASALRSSYSLAGSCLPTTVVRAPFRSRATVLDCFQSQEFSRGQLSAANFVRIGMPDPLYSRTRSFALLAVSVIIGGLICYGTQLFLSSHWVASKHPPLGITHSTPVGGAVEDGVYRSTPAPADVGSELSIWRI